MKGTNRQSGISIVEFALVLPVLMLLFFSIVEFGVAFYKQQVLTSAAREAARIGVVAVNPRPTAAQVEEEVYAYLDEVGLDPGKSVVTVSGAGGSTGDLLTVEVSYPAGLSVVSSLIGSADSQVPSGVTVTARAQSSLE